MYANTSNAYRIYESNNVKTASPKGLIIMLYEGAIKFCRFAEMAINENNIERRNENLKKAQDILTELQVTLNHDAGEIAEKLEMLYAYMNSELVQANIQNDGMKVAYVRSMLEELKEAWNAII
ncbi:MAG: flagellar export chaperone FliS [Clostridiales bacterium]|nr:flagellar export chaperone FliS [Clostridiales bacterium]